MILNLHPLSVIRLLGDYLSAYRVYNVNCTHLNYTGYRGMFWHRLLWWMKKSQSDME